MKLRIGYLISGIATGFILLFSFLTSLPDGKLHIVFCDVGQGDAAYIRFPDGRDMVVDGGPNNKILGCLGSHMPFWDRSLDVVILTHPQKDHMQGLIEVVRRYDVGYFVRSDVAGTTQGHEELLAALAANDVDVRFAVQGQQITLGEASLGILWPSESQIALGRGSSNVLGASTVGDLNDYSIVFRLRYGTFDAVFTGDADRRVESKYRGTQLADDTVEVLKVPHHGSRTGMSTDYLDWLRPQLAVISVGRNNTYGHPAGEILTMLRDRSIQTLRTDEEGDIEIVTDGIAWSVISQ
jgi:competence protein ComEC